MKKNRTLMGTVGVDSARLIIVDPRYVEFEEELSEWDGDISEGDLDFIEVPFGGNATGILFRSGLGDGTYKVYATTQEVGAWGKRITKVEIILIDDGELDLYRDDCANKLQKTS